MAHPKNTMCVLWFPKPGMSTNGSSVCASLVLLSRNLYHTASMSQITFDQIFVRHLPHLKVQKVLGVGLRIVKRHVHLPHAAAHSPRVAVTWLGSVKIIGRAVVHLIRFLNADVWNELLVATLRSLAHHHSTDEHVLHSVCVWLRIVVRVLRGQCKISALRSNFGELQRWGYQLQFIMVLLG